LVVILTAVGEDRPGLTQSLADAIHQAGGNWLESHFARLGGQYVGSVLVELPGERLRLTSILRILKPARKIARCSVPSCFAHAPMCWCRVKPRLIRYAMRWSAFPARSWWTLKKRANRLSFPSVAASIRRNCKAGCGCRAVRQAGRPSHL